MKSFELQLAEDTKASAADLTLGELKQRKFRMKVNNKLYDVYPDLISLVRSPEAVTKYKQQMGKIEDIENSIPIVRQVILRDYYKALVSEMKKASGPSNRIL